MHLLCLFRLILRDNYAFQFFGKAVESAVIDIDQNPELDIKTKVLALFFLSIIYMDLELPGTESFEAVLRDHAKDLPLSIQLGIHHEMERWDLKGALIRHHEKQLKKAMKGNTTLKFQLENMYNRSIRSLKQIAKNTSRDKATKN